MAVKKKYGQGLGAVFGESLESVLDEIANGKTSDIGPTNTLNVDEIRPNPYQPRKTFKEEDLEDLTNSIKERGVFQPILVRKAVQGYELIAGERRLRASKLAGKKDIPAIVLDVDDQGMMELSILENIQRSDLNIVEEAQGYEQLIKKIGYTQEELSKRIGKSRAHITNVLRILKLPQEVLELLSKEKLTFGHARALINIADESKQIELAKKVVSEGLSVRDIEKMAQSAKGVEPKPKKKDSDPYIENVRRMIETRLSTSVQVDKKKIVINYKNNEDLNRILEIMDCLEEN